MATMLRARELGDVEVNAAILLAFVEVFGSRTRTKAEFDATLMLIERGFMGPEVSTASGRPGR
jgi:hypothetical protein